MPKKKLSPQQKWAKKNREKLRAARRRWRKRHPEKQKAATYRWRRKNLTKWNGYMRRWRRRNPETVRRYTRTRYRKLKADPERYAKHLAAGQAWAAANPKAIRRRARQYRKKNLKRVRTYHRRWMKRWYRTHLWEARSKRKLYRLSNIRKWRQWDRKYYREKLRVNPNWVARKLARGKLWVKRNPLKQRHRVSLYRARRMAARGSHTLEEWIVVVGRYRWRCFYCGKRLNRKTVTKDHKKPLSKGGTNFIWNLVPACKPCNSGKSGRLRYTKRTGR